LISPLPYGKINFLMSPSEPQELMQKQYAPVKEHLNSEAGMTTKLKYARNYSAVLQAMGSGTADIAETGPFSAALGVNADKADIALQRYAYGSWDYSSVIVTKTDSDISSLSDLEGESVGFADRLSASGALFPLFMLSEAGLDIGSFPQEEGSAEFDATFSGHSQAFTQLENDQVVAAGVGQFITLNDDRELKDGYEYVETYDGIPRAPIVTSPELSDEEQSALVDAMKDAPEEMYLGEDGEADTDDDLWFSDVRPADVETYQPVIDVATELGIEAEFLDS
jgi:phosphonate transport system substrate-binding protein